MIGDIIMAMVKENKGDNRRINHALKVYGLARCIAEAEGMTGDALITVEATAVLHDIGIAHCEKAFGKCTGKMQEEYGPAIAQRILEDEQMSEQSKERVLYLIAHHHTYDNIDGIDYRIIVEADFLVNAEEKNISEAAFSKAYDKFFRTRSAKELAAAMFELGAE
ncbi:MAG: HD domain-containing protein [Clostridia bacterium]|jgi:HD superfamily phosphodiesterase|nr:HD domain-containing protein [Clostridia bacterium]MBT7121775.1 HD domain-containing protein [Clostridia bacterium]